MAELPSLRDDAFWDTSTQEPLVPAHAGGKQRKEREYKERVETRGRARALQALYAADMRDFTQLKRIASQVFDDLSIVPDERKFASQLIATVADHGAEIDAALADVTVNWRFERLGAIERSVLRVAAAEFRRETVPVKVVLKEAVRLAERFGSERSAQFVNGVLDAYARRLGRL
ncbi:MAG: transcription antitermination factor NusB [Phycisphaerae bacterium]|nr:transcription antitermination factor NusB [Gemmatimonadaceae bacterium]